MNGGNNLSLSKPDPGVVKINVDAAIFSDANTLEADMVLRDHNGMFLQAKTVRGRSLSFVVGQTLEYSAVEEDCKAFDGLQTNIIGVSEFYNLLATCQSLLSYYPNSNVSLVLRQTNQIVHNLIRASRLHIFKQIF